MKRLLLPLLLACAVSPARAQGPPDPATSVIGTVVVLGGSTNGVVDPLALKTISVRDAGNNPLPNATITIDFSSCTTADIRICDIQPHHPGAGFDCATKTFAALTDNAGVARFLIAGGSINNGGNPAGNMLGCAEVRSNGELLGTLRVAVPDENGSGGVNVLDLAGWSSDRFGSYRARSDLDGNGSINPIDLSLWAAFRFRLGSESSCSGVCP
jgi:hypothetical protein